jgi:nitroreductase
MRPIWGAAAVCPASRWVRTPALFEVRFQDRERDLYPLRFEAMTNPAIDLLLSRRSVSANSLGEPGPSAAELELILRSASRVPDHKKLVPWRFLLFQGEARAEFGKILAEVCAAEEKDPGAFRLETEAKRFLRAPLVIAVISCVVKNPAAPEWEQILSAGAACQNLILAATALGYGAQWITEWCAYSEGVRQALGLADNERVAGFVYIGTAKEKPDERERPKLAEIVVPWRP